MINQQLEGWCEKVYKDSIWNKKSVLWGENFKYNIKIECSNTVLSLAIIAKIKIQISYPSWEFMDHLNPLLWFIVLLSYPGRAYLK